MIVTIDNYYNIDFYKECTEALKNNKVDFKEYINIKSPFNWCIELEREPIMINYDKLTRNDEKFLVNKVQPNKPNTEYLYTRREDTGITSLLRYTENEAFKECRETGVFFHVKNKQQLIDISKEFPKKIWFIGKYKNNKYNVCLCSDPMIKNYIQNEDVLLENNFNEPGRFEAEFNFRVLALKDRIVKYDETPYALNGSFKMPNILGEHSSKFILS